MKSEWIHRQFADIDTKDARLQKRAVTIAEACTKHPEQSLPGCFEDWAGLKGAYRFFSNPKITHQILQRPHYKETLEKARFSDKLVLFIQDGSELLFNSHQWTHGLGPTADSSGNGLMFHSCLVAEYHEPEETKILGLSYQEAWIRSDKKSVNDDSKESEIWLKTLSKAGRPQKNWVHVGDRANDIHEFFKGAIDSGWNFVVRARHDRQVQINETMKRIFPWIRKQPAKCKFKLNLRAKGARFSGEYTVEVTWTKVKLFSPGKEDSEVLGDVTYIRTWCLEDPELEWLLITNLPVKNEADAIRIVNIYQQRWLIEEYHKAIKTGFRIENNQFKQASRILALFGMVGVMATQLLALKEHCHLAPTQEVEKGIPKRWIILIERVFNVKLETVRDFWRCLARLGGFIGRKSDGEPGWQTIWKGYRRLQDMLMGADCL
jgi:hypothetical protein